MSLRQSIGRVGRWPRLAAAAACLLLAAVSAIESSTAKPKPASSRAVVVAARTLPAGHVLVAGDLTIMHTPIAVPGASRQPRPLVDRRLAGPVARGEPITPLRLVDADLTTGLGPNTVAMSVDVTTDVRGLVSPGRRVDLLAVVAGEPTRGSTPRSGVAQRLAERVLVLATLPPDPSAGAAGCRLVLALGRGDAVRIAGARSTSLFQVAALPP